VRVRLKQQRLIDLLAHSTLSQNHWAIKLGLSKGHWSAIVNGRHPFPSPKTRERMLEVFKLPFDDLFEVESGPAEGAEGADASFQAAIADKYLIEKEVGQGGMGTVYLARDVKHNRTVAMKVVSPEAVSGIGTQQFLKEIRYIARLQHHHILPLYDSGEAAGFPYYVTPYLEDGRSSSPSKRLYRSHAASLQRCSTPTNTVCCTAT
jgi:transcriptional regulator with XRE-family HTH domain